MLNKKIFKYMSAAFVSGAFGEYMRKNMETQEKALEVVNSSSTAESDAESDAKNNVEGDDSSSTLIT